MTTNNSPRTPEAIAETITREWKNFWMNQTQNNEEDRQNYFGRAFGVDANMRVHLENKISAALQARDDYWKAQVREMCKVPQHVSYDLRYKPNQAQTTPAPIEEEK